MTKNLGHAAIVRQLAAYGCHEVQGFLLSPPIPADQFEALLRDRDRPAA